MAELTSAKFLLTVAVIVLASLGLMSGSASASEVADVIKVVATAYLGTTAVAEGIKGYLASRGTTSR